MIRRSIATDKGIARLNAEQTAVFCMILPHLDSYGKMIGEPAYVKEVALPFASWATVQIVEEALKAISRHTRVRWFRGRDGRRYLHAVQFERHQSLEKDKRGADLLPSYLQSKSASKSSSSRRPVVESVAPEVEVEGKEKEEVESEVPKTADASSGASRPPLARPPGNGNEKTATFSSFVDGLSTLKRQVLENAFELSTRGGKDIALRNLREAGFAGAEYTRAEAFVAAWATE